MHDGKLLMNYSYQRILFLSLFVFSAGTTKAAEPFEIKNSTSLIPEFISTWFATKKKTPPLTIKSDFQLGELIGAYPPKIYWIIEQLQKEDSVYLSNRLIL